MSLRIKIKYLQIIQTVEEIPPKATPKPKNNIPVHKFGNCKEPSWTRVAKATNSRRMSSRDTLLDGSESVIQTINDLYKSKHLNYIMRCTYKRSVSCQHRKPLWNKCCTFECVVSTDSRPFQSLATTLSTIIIWHLFILSNSVSLPPTVKRSSKLYSL